MSKGLFISFEGTEGCGKSTQVRLLTERLQSLGHRVKTLREPGGTPIGEEIRHTLKHSKANAEMKPETELLLMNASRAQLVRELIQPALEANEIVICDRFYDSTTAYQGYGRQMDLAKVRSIIELAVGELKPRITFYMKVSPAVSEERVRSRQAILPFVRDRFEESDNAFFERVTQGFEAIAKAEPERIKVINADRTVDQVCASIWENISPLLPRVGRW